MPAVVVTRKRVNVTGSRRQILATINIANNGDTFDTKLHKIEFWAAAGADTNAIGGTIAAGVITFATSGAENPTSFVAEGY